MEGAHFIKSKELIKLSEQQCLDCAVDGGGCNGGFIDDCLNYAEGEAIDTLAQYPYSGFSGTCFSKPDGPVKVSSYSQV